MIADLVGSALLSLVVSFGIAWPLAARLDLDPSEKVAVSVALSLLAIFVLAWAVYICALPTEALWVIPALTAGSLALGHRALAQTLRDPEARRLMISQIIVTAWCVGWLGMVVDYSGGKWVGDWFGHWQRALFFLFHWPPHMLFNGFDPLPSRPPLANVVTGAFLRLTRVDFTHYQLFSTVFSSLAFLPAALIARRLRAQRGTDSVLENDRTIGILVLIFMLSPMFVQNATYAWTKLSAAFFVLTAVYFFIRAHDVGAPRCAKTLCATTLAAGMLTHYSTGPYIVLLMAGWFWLGWPARRNTAWWKSTIVAAVFAALVLATWFGWSAFIYGFGTLSSNTTVTDQAPTLAGQLHTITLNLRDSVVPHFLGGADFTAFAQSSPWGWWRDWFFQLYQCNVIFAFGSVNWAVLLWIGSRDWSNNPGNRSRPFWLSFTVAAIILGIAVHGGRETGGVAHICLQPLVLFGLAYLAARWDSLSRHWRRVIVAGATIDLMAGIVLQLGAENHAFDRWFTPGRNFASMLSSYSSFAQINSRVKGDAGWILFGDIFAASFPLVVALLAAILLLAVVRSARINPGSK